MPGGPRFLSEASVRAMTTDQTGHASGSHPSMKGYAADRPSVGYRFALQTERRLDWTGPSSFRTFGHGGKRLRARLRPSLRCGRRGDDEYASARAEPVIVDSSCPVGDCLRVFAGYGGAGWRRS